MSKQTRMNAVYRDDINAYLGFDYSHMGFWIPPNEDFKKAQEEALSQLAAHLHLEPGDHVLDIGGGQAATAIWLTRTFDVQVTVVDIVEEMAQKGRDRVAAAGLADRINIVTCDILEFDSSSTFDAFISVEAVYHIADQAQLFAKLETLGRPGARFAFSAYVSELRPLWLSNIYSIATVGDRDIPNSIDYVRAADRPGIRLDAVEDKTQYVLPPSTAALRQPPYIDGIRDYHAAHYGRWSVLALPLFLAWHDWVVRRNKLRFIQIVGAIA